MTDAKKQLKRLNDKRIKKVKKNSIKGKIQKRKNQQKSDNSLQAQSSNPDSYTNSKVTSSASKGPGPLIRFCNGKSKPYSRKK